MKIDIHITDATPEEAAVTFCGISVQKAAETVVKKIVQKKPVPDPTFEETEREKDTLPDCPCDNGTCKECSPPPAPPAPIAPVLKEKYAPKTEKKPDGRKNNKRAANAKVNKFGTPSHLFSTDKQQYQRLWFRCSHKGIMYDEALKMEKPAADTSMQSAQAIPPSNEGKKPAKVKKARLPLRMKNQQAAPAAEEEQVTTRYPVETPPTGHKEKVENAKTMESIKIGDQVRQIAGMKICAGIGVVKRAPPGNPDVLVGFGNGQEWINRKNLAPVMA